MYAQGKNTMSPGQGSNPESSSRIPTLSFSQKHWTLFLISVSWWSWGDVELLEISWNGYLTLSLVRNKDCHFEDIFLLGRRSPLAYINDITTGVRSSMRGRQKGLRIIYDENDAGNNFNVTLTHYRNGVKIGNFVFILINVRFYVLPMREILLAILISYLAVYTSVWLRNGWFGGVTDF